ncbi:ESX-1 secretion-associated protein EspI-like [Zingiber officinale]|uniref:DUF4408 domain-containing protein n=1 Tax=Zingiber officinale TaxID=94328 RepID=A0A8J5GS63_ZINOF|nr:ESX-1 secretion-associated protein EspI-like [Zingiber officinale]KAG6508980.1 hypothetical protein ZIOFF_034363 [Zingiber officinale]
MADRRRSPSNGVQKAVWASKIVFSLLGILSVVRLAVPPAAGVLAPALPRLWASLCSCLSPPYLFVVIHLIVLVIWKLSDQKHHHGPPEATEAVKIKAFESAPPPPAAQAVPLSPRPTPATPKPLDPDSDGDPLDKEAESSEENDSMEATWKAIMEKTPRGGENPGPRRPPPPPSPPPEATEAVKIKSFESAPPPPAAQAAPLSPRPTPATPKPLDPDSDGNPLDKEAESSEENDSMEATWKAIMEKTPRGGENPGPRRPPPPPSPPTAAIRARLPSVTGRDELNRRFDDFIKKRHDQIRLQRHESNQRRLQMMDSGFH